MNSSSRFWLAAGAALLVSLASKVILGVLRDRLPEAPSANEKLREFLIASRVGPVAPVWATRPAPGIVGWRFGSGVCAGQAFPSDLPGNLDFQAQTHAPDRAHVSYVYRGLVERRPPKMRLAVDVITFRLFSEFTPTRAHEPSYVVVVYAASCSASPSLRWDRLRLN
ncbi:MAG TPA: hypothetical protein VGI30_00225 [Caulobacteraceae bacterium]